MKVLLEFVGTGVLDGPFESHDLPRQSHSRAVSLDTLASCAPCFMPSTVVKRILNLFHDGCKLFAQHSNRPRRLEVKPTYRRRGGSNSSRQRRQPKKNRHPIGCLSSLCCLDKIDATRKKSIKSRALGLFGAISCAS